MPSVIIAQPRSDFDTVTGVPPFRAKSCEDVLIGPWRTRRDSTPTVWVKAGASATNVVGPPETTTATGALNATGIDLAILSASALASGITAMYEGFDGRWIAGTSGVAFESPSRVNPMEPIDAKQAATLTPQNTNSRDNGPRIFPNPH